MKTQARIVVIGGGIVGCSTAYHLALNGEKDVLLLEKGELTSGSTWHAAGLVGQLRSDRNITQMLKYSVELYQRLFDLGYNTGWKKVGGIRLACTPERVKELQKAQTTAKSFGLPFEMLSPKEAQDLFPIMSTRDVICAAFLPTDGSADPSGITLALAKEAQNLGVTIQKSVRVLNILTKKGRVHKVVTDQGEIETEVVVNCAGMWARQVGEMVGANIPLIPVQHQYLVTQPIPGLPKDLPTLRDPDHLIYYKEEMGGLVMGGYEPNPLPWILQGPPKEFGQELLEPDYEHFQQLADPAMVRTPCLKDAGILKLINGPEAFTPDGNFLLGECPEVDGFFVGAGFNAHGIAAGGGAGKLLSEWILYGAPSIQMWSGDIRRFGPYTKNISYVKDRTLELYAKHYTISWPHEEHKTARGLKKSPLYEKLKNQGAVFGAKFGWERPNWFAPQEVAAEDKYTFDVPNWFEHVGNEHKAIREKVALIDQSSFSKFSVKGKDALNFLNYLAVNDIAKPSGKLTYTQLCDDKGGIQADLTIARLGEEEFYITTGTAFGHHDLHWLKKNIRPEDKDLQIEDVSGRYAVLNICGPHSRKLLKRVTETDLSNQAFPFASVQKVAIGHVDALLLRVTYVGELGWELHCPTEHAAYIYDLLWENGKDLGIQNAGYRAIESCRLEKGYLYWSGDITPDYNPFEAGLGFCVNFKKEVNFKGRFALEKIKTEGVKQSLCSFTLDGCHMIHGGETFFYQGRPLSVTSSGGYGHTVKKTIVYGYIPKECVDETGFSLEIKGERFPLTKLSNCVYDPKREKVLSDT